MLTNLLVMVINTYAMILLLRIWMQWARTDFYNPLSQFVVKVTQPAIRPLRRVIPPLGPIDSASLLIAFLLLTLKYPLMELIISGGISLSLVNLLAGLVSLIKTAGSLIFWVVIIRSLLSWVTQGRGPMDYLLMQLTEPLMGPIRRILPALGGIDFSGMIIVIILYILDNFFANLNYIGTLWQLP